MGAGWTPLGVSTRRWHRPNSRNGGQLSLQRTSPSSRTVLNSTSTGRGALATATQYTRTASSWPEATVQSTLSRTCLMRKSMEPGKASNARFDSPRTSGNAASGSASIAPRSFGVSMGTPLTLLNGPFTTVRTQCKLMMSGFDGPPGIQGLKEMKPQTDWQTSVLDRTGILEWPQSPQSVGSDRSTGTCGDRRNAPGGQNAAPSSPLGTRNGTLSIELGHCLSLTYHGQCSIACLRFAHPTGTSPGITRSSHTMTPNSTAPAVGRRLQCTWCTAAKRPDFLAN